MLKSLIILTLSSLSFLADSLLPYRNFVENTKDDVEIAGNGTSTCIMKDGPKAKESESPILS